MKAIILTESVTVALESVKQALEVFWGCEISFTGHMQIDPGKIDKRKVEDQVCEFQNVRIEGAIRERISPDGILEPIPQRLHADVELNDKGLGWTADRAHLGLGLLGGRIRGWYWAHWGYRDDDISVVRVAMEFGDASTKEWHIGRGIADRRIEPL
ncbi:MAG: hypothetical protein A3B31_02365 [Candidatus Komeilibacteria bacterium RIFCSPLOWO2_01_FULL_53_11]|uniref:Uncharacterized protein n=1 Tax=Candidatus Komeilibacteria bacterium RIFCSPLOWO2_01_FULL_53_11 TaxID=1798552 RepID=A0A1G2BVN7_9BACT|nr:MAG: hypothetical protein A3B31_02365 [Candidatus Komeilibacteria bacterium RIFCSPLOWO2_01_FULL_53_11]